MRCSLQNLRQPLLPMLERSLQTPAHKSRSECAQPSEGQRELDRIAYPCPFHALMRLRFNPMAVKEPRERPVHLLVAKMAVPFELGDARHPTHALWHPANRIKTDQDLRPHARCHTAEAPRRIGRNGPWTRRLHPHIFNPRRKLRRHQMWKIHGIREKCEDQLYRIGNPLAGLESLRHDSRWYPAAAKGERKRQPEESSASQQSIAAPPSSRSVFRGSVGLARGSALFRLEERKPFLVRQKHRIDHVNYAVRLKYIGDCDGSFAALFICEHQLAHVHRRLERSTGNSL